MTTAVCGIAANVTMVTQLSFQLEWYTIGTSKIIRWGVWFVAYLVLLFCTLGADVGYKFSLLCLLPFSSGVLSMCYCLGADVP